MKDQRFRPDRSDDLSLGRTGRSRVEPSKAVSEPLNRVVVGVGELDQAIEQIRVSFEWWFVETALGHQTGVAVNFRQPPPPAIQRDSEWKPEPVGQKCVRLRHRLMVERACPASYVRSLMAEHVGRSRRAAPQAARRLAIPPEIERSWTPDHEAMVAALRVVLGLPRQLPDRGQRGGR